MIVVYIASPYTLGNKEENVNRQIDVAEQLSKKSFCPFWPLHSHFWHKQYPHNYQFWMDMDYVWIERCDVLLRLPGTSYGADEEVALAQRLGKPVYYSIESLLEAKDDRLCYRNRLWGVFLV